MLSDEEMKAIEFLKMAKNLKIVLASSFWNNGKFEFTEIQKQQFDIVLNLIEKQKKEIEELKDADLTSVYLDGVYEGEKKVKDKIKARIEKLEKEYEKYKGNKGLEFSRTGLINSQIQCLHSLLEKE